MAAFHEQSCRIRVTSYFAAVLLLLLVLNCRGLGDLCKRRWFNFSKFRKMEVSPLPSPKIQKQRTHTHIHTHTHTHTHIHIHTFKIWKEHFLCIFSQTNVCGLLKSSQQLHTICYTLFTICYRFFVFYDPYIPTYCIRAERLIKTLPNLSRKR